MLMATCCEDDIVPHVLPFVTEHIKNTDWRYRDAAVMAFGMCCHPSANIGISLFFVDVIDEIYDRMILFLQCSARKVCCDNAVKPEKLMNK